MIFKINLTSEGRKFTQEYKDNKLKKSSSQKPF